MRVERPIVERRPAEIGVAERAAMMVVRRGRRLIAATRRMRADNGERIERVVHLLGCRGREQLRPDREGEEADAYDAETTHAFAHGGTDTRVSSRLS